MPRRVPGEAMTGYRELEPGVSRGPAGGQAAHQIVGPPRESGSLQEPLQVVLCRRVARPVEVSAAKFRCVRDRLIEVEQDQGAVVPAR